MNPNKLKKSLKNKADKGAASALLDELFQDMYNHRLRIYRINLVRGILFGAGSILGGTLIIALILWLLSLLDQFPFIENIRQSIEAGRQN